MNTHLKIQYFTLKLFSNYYNLFSNRVNSQEMYAVVRVRNVSLKPTASSWELMGVRPVPHTEM